MLGAPTLREPAAWLRAAAGTLLRVDTLLRVTGLLEREPPKLELVPTLELLRDDTPEKSALPERVEVVPL